ncbi:hypothetical protein C823_003867 [Eubacterium plexicaudatum ASF492]|uniref:Uncharacterized protein n=1 Tax=Eubacterium plexicaudatum ASF492 TaxID=1235802 RepID=N1ZXU6_9FIRM|nr:hypothetical protein C823_003867 [Eubacterium plexicaudatum ASF492]
MDPVDGRTAGGGAQTEIKTYDPALFGCRIRYK